MVGQGCDLSVFKTKVDNDVPGDLKQIEGPIIGCRFINHAEVGC